MIDDRDKILRFSESERAMTYQLDLVFHPFEGSTGDPQLPTGEGAPGMLFDEVWEGWSPVSEPLQGGSC